MYNQIIDVQYSNKIAFIPLEFLFLRILILASILAIANEDGNKRLDAPNRPVKPNALSR